LELIATGAVPDYTAASKIENSEDFDKTHNRRMIVDGKPYSGKGITSVTELLKASRTYEDNSPFVQQKMEKAAHEGTYAHKLMEIMGGE